MMPYHYSVTVAKASHGIYGSLAQNSCGGQCSTVHVNLYFVLMVVPRDYCLTTTYDVTLNQLNCPLPTNAHNARNLL